MSQEELKTEGFVQGEEVCDASSGEQCTPCIFTLSPPPLSSSTQPSQVTDQVSGQIQDNRSFLSLWFLSSHSLLNNLNFYHHPDLSPSQGPAVAHYYL